MVQQTTTEKKLLLPLNGMQYGKNAETYFSPQTKGKRSESEQWRKEEEEEEEHRCFPCMDNTGSNGKGTSRVLRR
jgi:hypothetical protein